MSTMGGMYVGVSGLQTSQNALNTTAHNLTNVNTEGYSRQQVLLTDLSYNKIGETKVNVNSIGIGTTVSSVRLVRDNFLDAAYREEKGRENFYLAQYEGIDEVQNYFGELESNTFNKNLQDLWSAIQEVQKESNSGVSRSALIATASTFIDKANEIQSQLVAYQTNLNGKIISQVGSINEKADKILALNKQIIAIEASGVESANDLRDQRDALIDELSGLIDIDVTENADHSVDVYAEGRCLVTLDRTYKMGTANSDTNSDFLIPMWKDDQTEVFSFFRVPNAEAGTDVGSLKGLLMTRGGYTPTYADIPVAPVKPVAADYANTADYNTAYAKYQVDIQQYEADTYTYNNTVEPYAVANIIATFDQLIHGMVTGINDILSPNKEITLSDGTKMTVLDEEKAGVGLGSGNDTIQGTELFTRNGVSRYTDRTVSVLQEDGTVATMTVKEYNKEDTYTTDPVTGDRMIDKTSLYTLGNLQVNQELLSNPSLLPINSKDGGEYQEITNELLQLWQSDFATLNPNTLINNTFTEYYATMIEDFANKGYTYNKIANTQNNTVNEINAQRQQVVGVSSDEELSNLIKFQHAYNASSRYITVVSEMLETIINKLG